MAKTAHGTVTADQVSTVIIQQGFTVIEVVNRTYDGTELWVRLDGIDPEIEGPDSYVVVGTRSFDRQNRFDATEIRLISDKACRFSIEGGS